MKRHSVGLAIALAVFLVFIRAVNLEADPDPAITTDNAFFTDEGWHAGGAMAKLATGEWLLDTPYHNHILIMPLIPLIEYGTFKALGISLFSGRLPILLFSLLASFLIVAFAAKKDDEETKTEFVIPLAVFLVGTDYYFFGYSRLVFLDVPMLALGLLSLFLLARAMKEENGSLASWFRRYAASGAVFALAFLAKPTAVIFALAALLIIAFRTCVRGAFRKQELLGACFFLLAAAAVIGASKLGINALVRNDTASAPYYLISDKFVFHPLTILGNYVSFFKNPLIRDNLLLVILAGASAAIALTRAVRRRRFSYPDAALGSLALASCLVIGFFTYQPPRYFIVLIAPLAYFAATLPLNLNAVLSPRLKKIPAGGVCLTIAAALLVLAAQAKNISKLADHVLHPRFSIRAVAQSVRADLGAPALTGEISSTLALANGLPFSYNGLNQEKPRYLISEGPMENPPPATVLLRSYDMLQNYMGLKVYVYREN